MTFSIPFMDSFAQAANAKGGDVDRGPPPRSLPSRELSPKGEEDRSTKPTTQGTAYDKTGADFTITKHFYTRHLT